MRLKNLDFLLSRVILQGVPGCFLEAGVWRGGVSMYARAVLDLLGEERRDVFLCDSFEGLPPPSTPTDSDWSKLPGLKVSEEEVKKNFEAVQISLERVHFVKGYFQQSLPVLRDRFRKEGMKLAVLRGDGDMYESYKDILYNLYEFVSVGGYFICDDCSAQSGGGDRGALGGAHRAVLEFHSAHGIRSPIVRIHGSDSGVYWKKGEETEVLYEDYKAWNATRNQSGMHAPVLR